MSIPGVHSPHCAPPISWNACWSGESGPSPASPSTVTTSWPSTWPTGTRPGSRRRARRRRSTAHAPHSPSPQPSLVPVRPRSRRRTSSRRRPPAGAAATSAPLTRKRSVAGGTNGVMTSGPRRPPASPRAPSRGSPASPGSRPGRVVDRRHDRGSRDVHRELTEALRPMGNTAERPLHQDGLDPWRVERRRDQVGGEAVVAVPPARHEHFLHRGVAHGLERAASTRPSARTVFTMRPASAAWTTDRTRISPVSRSASTAATTHAQL